MTDFSPDYLPLPPEPKGDDEHLVEAMYEAHVRTLGLDAIRQPSWDRMPEWKRESWRREYRDA